MLPRFQPAGQTYRSSARRRVQRGVVATFVRPGFASIFVPEVGAVGSYGRDGQTHRARGRGFGEELGSALRRDGRQGDRGLHEPALKDIARDLVAHVRESVTIDWALREAAQAQIRVIVRRILRKYGYLPNDNSSFHRTVLIGRGPTGH